MNASEMPPGGRERAGGASGGAGDPAILGLGILLGSLTIFFAGGLVAYYAARTGRIGRIAPAEIDQIPLPIWFWVSTLVILVSSAVLQYSLASARVDHARRARRAFLATTLLGYLFLALQIPGLAGLVEAHRALGGENYLINGIVLFLVILHALHVIGGLVPLTKIASASARIPLDAARGGALRRVSIYWHFLAVVWLVMFNTFLLAG